MRRSSSEHWRAVQTLLSLIPPSSLRMDSPPVGPHPFIPFLTALAAKIQVWVDNGLDPSRIRSLLQTHLTWPVRDWGNESFFGSLQLTPSAAPPPCPSLPQRGPSPHPPLSHYSF